MTHDPTRDCEHGRMKGKCDVCDLQAEVERLQYEVDAIPAIKEERDALVAEVERLKAAQPVDEPYGYFQYSMHMDAWVQNRDSNKGVAFYTRNHPAAREPIKPVVDPKFDANQRLYFEYGWKSAEAAHGITGETK